MISLQAAEHHAEYQFRTFLDVLYQVKDLLDT